MLLRYLFLGSCDLYFIIFFKVGRQEIGLERRGRQVAKVKRSGLQPVTSASRTKASVDGLRLETPASLPLCSIFSHALHSLSSTTTSKNAYVESVLGGQHGSVFYIYFWLAQTNWAGSPFCCMAMLITYKF